MVDLLKGGPPLEIKGKLGERTIPQGNVTVDMEEYTIETRQRTVRQTDRHPRLQRQNRQNNT